MEQQSGIYKILNKVSGDFYIGSSKNIDKRISNHFKSLEKGKHHSQRLQRAWDKYGKDSFVSEIIEFVEPCNLLKIEQNYLDNLNPPYNMRSTANGGLDFHTEETKAKISKASIGKKRSEEVKKRVSEGARRRYERQEERDKTSKIHKGKIVSDETKRKITEAKTGMRYGPHSEEHKRKLSESVKATKAKRKLEKELNERLSQF